MNFYVSDKYNEFLDYITTIFEYEDELPESIKSGIHNQIINLGIDSYLRWLNLQR